MGESGKIKTKSYNDIKSQLDRIQAMMGTERDSTYYNRNRAALEAFRRYRGNMAEYPKVVKELNAETRDREASKVQVPRSVYMKRRNNR